MAIILCFFKNDRYYTEYVLFNFVVISDCNDNYVDLSVVNDWTGSEHSLRLYFKNRDEKNLFKVINSVFKYKIPIEGNIFLLDDLKNLKIRKSKINEFKISINPDDLYLTIINKIKLKNLLEYLEENNQEKLYTKLISKIKLLLKKNETEKINLESSYEKIKNEGILAVKIANDPKNTCFISKLGTSIKLDDIKIINKEPFEYYTGNYIIGYVGASPAILDGCVLNISTNIHLTKDKTTVKMKFYRYQLSFNLFLNTNNLNDDDKLLLKLL